MATFDQLSAEQRAIIELILQRGQSYEQLSDMLSMPSTRVQELARDALITLSPVSARSVDDDWRGQLADYVLGQQSGPESTATRGHLRRSEPARTWTRSLLDSLDNFYTDGLPSIPDGERGGRERVRDRRPLREPRAHADDEPAAPREPLTPEAEAEVRRRRMIGFGGAAVVALLLIVLVWPVGLLTGSNDKKDSSSSSSGTQNAAGQNPTVIGQVALKPLKGQTGQGVAVIAQRSGQLQLVVQARLTPSKPKQAYEVWLYNTQSDAKSVGAQVTDQQGNFQGAGPLPANYRRFKFIDISLEKVDNNAKHSGISVLRAPIAALQKPSDNQGAAGAQGGAAPQQTAPPAGGQTTSP